MHSEQVADRGKRSVEIGKGSKRQRLGEEKMEGDRFERRAGEGKAAGGMEEGEDDGLNFEGEK